MTFVGFSLSNPLTKSWHNKQRLGDALVQPRLISALDPPRDQASRGLGSRPPAPPPRAGLLSAVEAKPLVRFPDYRRVAGLLAAYLIVLSPFAYLAFRKLDRLELAWGLCPVVALVFAAIPYASDVSKRGRKASVSELRLIETSVGQSTGLATSLFVAYSPSAAECNVSFEDGTPLVADFHTSSAHAKRRGDLNLDVAVGPKTTISDLSILRQSVRSFGAQATVDLSQGIHVRAQTRDRTQLAISNGSGFDLARAYLFDPKRNRAARIGNLPFGVRRQVSLSWESWHGAISGVAPSEKKHSGLDDLLGVTMRALRQCRDRALLVACSEDLTPISIDGRTMDTAGATLMVVHLPRRILSAKQEARSTPPQ